MSSLVRPSRDAQEKPLRPRGREKGQQALKRYLEAVQARLAAGQPSPPVMIKANPADHFDDDWDDDDAAADRKRGPHWGGFWPAEHVPELDDVCFESATPRHDPNGFAVYSSDGLLLGVFDDRWRAIGALNRWPEADCVVFDRAVIARREHGTKKVGTRVPDPTPAEIAERCAEIRKGWKGGAA